MKVINKLKIYEINNKELSIGEYKTLDVCSHPTDKRKVMIKTLEGASITVDSHDMEMAIKNATNCII